MNIIEKEYFNLDYEKDIIPLILKYKIDDMFDRLNLSSHSFFEEYAISSGAWIFEILLPYCIKTISDYNSFMKDFSDTHRQVEKAKKDYNTYQELLHYYLKKTSSQIAKKYIELNIKIPNTSLLDRKLKILEFFIFVGDDIKFKDNVPKELYPQMYHLIKNAINLVFSEFYETYPTPNLEFIEEKTSLKKYPKNIYMYQDGLVISGYKFRSEKDIKGCFLYPLEKQDIQFILFQNCEFEELYTSSMNTNVYFQNCIFSDKIEIWHRRDYDMEFNGCLFYKEIVIACSLYSCNLSIFNSTFEESAHLIISLLNLGKYQNSSDVYRFGIDDTFLINEKTEMVDKMDIRKAGLFGFGKDNSLILSKLDAMHHGTSKLILENVIINSRLDWECIYGINVILKNVSFSKGFRMSESLFGKNTSVSNICFPVNKNLEFEKSKKDLYDVLIDSDLDELAENLDLISKKRKANDSNQTYQDALQTGWLKPEYAARFLGRSIRTLQEKRKKDKYQITRDSIPFIGEGKDILYPLEALKAYLAQDWNLLKELRKKHWKK